MSSSKKLVMLPPRKQMQSAGKKVIIESRARAALLAQEVKRNSIMESDAINAEIAHEIAQGAEMCASYGFDFESMTVYEHEPDKKRHQGGRR